MRTRKKRKGGRKAFCVCNASSVASDVRKKIRGWNFIGSQIDIMFCGKGTLVTGSVNMTRDTKKLDHLTINAEAVG